LPFVFFFRSVQRTHESGTLKPTKRYIDDSSVRSIEADGIDTTKSKRRFKKKSGQTRKSQTSWRPERRRQPFTAVNATDVWQQLRATKVPA
jgi:hypothetical protein